MPVVSEIFRSNDTQESAVRENTAKAQRTLCSLMSSGLHGENGLDPETCTHLLQTYVLSIMVYGLEVMLVTTQSRLQCKLTKFSILKVGSIFYSRTIYRY